MKGAQTASAIVAALLLGSIIVGHAQAPPATDSASVIVVSSMPTSGTFWSMQLTNFPPWPVDPFPDLPLYTDGRLGNYFYDDREIDYSAYWASLAAQAQSSGNGRMMAEGVPMPPGDGGSGSGGSNSAPFISIPTYTNTATCETFNNFFLVFSNSPPDVFVGIESTLAGTTYLLLTNADLTTTNWGIYRTLVASSSNTWADPIVVTGTSNLFFKAQILWPNVLWETNLSCLGDQWGNGIDASPALSLDGNTVYIPSTGNLIYALDTYTGAIKWTNGIITTGGSMTSSAAVTSNAVYVGSGDGFLYSFRTNLAFNRAANLCRDGLSDVGAFATPAVTAGGEVYLGSDEGLVNGHYSAPDTGFFSFHTNSGENWFFAPEPLGANGDSDVQSSCAVSSNGVVYFLAEDFRFYALSPSGDVLWFVPLPGHSEPDSSPAIAADGSIVVGGNSPYLYSINPDGSIRWTCHVPNPDDTKEAIYSSPVIDSSGNVYIGGAQSISTLGIGVSFLDVQDEPSGGVYAISNNGNLLWAFTNVPGWIVGSCALGADGTVYVGSASTDHSFGVLYALTNGQQLWAYQTGSDIVSSPLITSDGGVIVTCEDSNVYKLQGCTPLDTNAPWPMFHHDPQLTGSLAGTNCPGQSCAAPFPFNGQLPGNGQQDFTFNVLGTSNSTWSVYASTNLSTNRVQWTNTEATVTTDANGVGTFTDVNQVFGVTNVFYFLSNGCCSKVIGFIVFTPALGTNLIANPFIQVDDNVLASLTPAGMPPMNSVTALFCESGGASPVLPQGTTISSLTDAGFLTDTNEDGAREWAPNGDIELLPGVGAVLNIPTNSNIQPMWFIGWVRESVTNQIQPGVNYLGSALPLAGGISTRLGFTNATAGDWLQRWDTTNRVFINYTNNGGTNWSPREPYLGLAEGFILHSATNHTWVQRFSP